MGKLDDFLQTYTESAGIILEQDPMAAPPPVDPMAAGAPAPAAAAPPPPEVKQLTDQAYVNLLRDCLQCLTISPRELSPNDQEIFSDEVTPTNALDVHDRVRDLIDRYGTPNA